MTFGTINLILLAIGTGICTSSLHGQTWSMCPDSIGTDHCLKLRQLRKECLVELVKLKRKKTMGNDSSSVGEEMFSSLYESVQEIERLEGLIVDFEPIDIDTILYVGNNILQNNFIARNGTVAQSEIENIVPDILRWIKNKGEMQKDLVAIDLLEEMKRKKLADKRSGWKLRDFMLGVSIVINGIVIFYLINYRKK